MLRTLFEEVSLVGLARYSTSIRTPHARDFEVDGHYERDSWPL